MSRIEYAEEEDYPGQFALWHANVERSLAGVKGQAALRDLEAALLALPGRRLIADAALKNSEVCAVSAIVVHRRVSLGQAREEVLRELEGDYKDFVGEDDDDCYTDYGWTEDLGVAAGVPRLVAWRLVALNDIDLDYLTPEQRYERILAWTRRHLRGTPDE